MAYLCLLLLLSPLLGEVLASPEVKIGATTLLGRDIPSLQQEFFGGLVSSSHSWCPSEVPTYRHPFRGASCWASAFETSSIQRHVWWGDVRGHRVRPRLYAIRKRSPYTVRDADSDVGTAFDPGTGFRRLPDSEHPATSRSTFKCLPSCSFLASIEICGIDLDSHRHFQGLWRRLW
jgi:hypothetical protein